MNIYNQNDNDDGRPPSVKPKSSDETGIHRRRHSSDRQHHGSHKHHHHHSSNDGNRHSSHSHRHSSHIHRHSTREEKARQSGAHHHHDEKLNQVPPSPSPNQVGHTDPPHEIKDPQFLAYSAPPMSELDEKQPATSNDTQKQASYAKENEPKNEEATIDVPITAATIPDMPLSHYETEEFAQQMGMTNEDSSSPSPAVIYNHSNETRQGQACCGGCCDFRRAVIITNIIIIILEVVVLILVATGTFSLSLYQEDVEEVDSSISVRYEKIEIIFSGVSVALSGFAIVGACLYSSFAVGLNALWLLIAYVLGFVFGTQYCNDYCDAYEDPYYSCTCSLNGFTVFVSAVVMVLFVYPHIGFIVQVEKGIMSRETYQREEYSCCCV